MLADQRSSDAALERYGIIAPLLDETLDDAAFIDLRRKQAEKYGISDRTVRRYLDRYKSGGFEGLKTKRREHYHKEGLPEDFDSILQEAILLRREVPGRSVEKIILILEMEGKVEKGVLKRSTLQKHMHDAGFGRTQIRIYADSSKMKQTSSKRYCKPNRMMMVQADLKNGPLLPIGPKGEMVQTYLSTAIDDHSRFLLHSQFYDNMKGLVVEDTMHKAILKFGHFDQSYFDHGSQYTSRDLKLALSKLSIRVSYAPVGKGQSKGVVEKFHQVVDGFIAEAKAQKIKTLEELNYYWEIYREQYYHNDPHDGIREYYKSKGINIPPEGITPRQEWNRDKRPLRYLDTALVNEAFLHHETRIVDRGGCISFNDLQYETKTSLIGFKVEIAYDPNAPETITVSYPGIEPFKAVPLEIGSQCDVSEPVPATLLPVEPETSRFLNALEKIYKENRQDKADAISFGSFKKGV